MRADVPRGRKQLIGVVDRDIALEGLDPPEVVPNGAEDPAGRRVGVFVEVPCQVRSVAFDRDCDAQPPGPPECLRDRRRSLALRRPPEQREEVPFGVLLGDHRALEVVGNLPELGSRDRDVIERLELAGVDEPAVREVGPTRVGRDGRDLPKGSVVDGGPCPGQVELGVTRRVEHGRLVDGDTAHAAAVRTRDAPGLEVGPAPPAVSTLATPPEFHRRPFGRPAENRVGGVLEVLSYHTPAPEP